MLHKRVTPFLCHESSRKPPAQSFWNGSGAERFLRHEPQPAAGDPKTQPLHLENSRNHYNKQAEVLQVLKPQ